MESDLHTDLQVDLQPIPFERDNLDFLRDLATQRQIQYFNARFAQGKITSLSLLKKISKSSNMGIGKGYSIQAFVDGGYGFATGLKFDKESIADTFNNAADLAHWSAKFVKNKFSITETAGSNTEFTIPQKISLGTTSPDTKMTLLREIEDEAYYDPRIISTSVNYTDMEVENIIYNNFNRFARIRNSWVFFILQSIARDGNRQEGYHVSHGKIGGFEALEEARGLGKIASDSSLELLNSKLAPGGTFDIIMDPLLTGTFIHEAFGHTAEADSILSGESILAGKLNSNVGSELVNIVDDPTLENRFGYIPIDSEGTPSSPTQIVKNGELVGYLHSLETASKMGVAPSGNG
ncbi:MAG: TldD/PmbA family protein, partial [Promethearchaeota archaeon]